MVLETKLFFSDLNWPAVYSRDGGGRSTSDVNRAIRTAPVLVTDSEISRFREVRLTRTDCSSDEKGAVHSVGYQLFIDSV